MRKRKTSNNSDIPVGKTNGDVNLRDVEVGDVLYDVDSRYEQFAVIKILTKPRFGKLHADPVGDWEFTAKHIKSGKEVTYIIDNEYSVLVPALWTENKFPEFAEI